MEELSRKRAVCGLFVTFLWICLTSGADHVTSVIISGSMVEENPTQTFSKLLSEVGDVTKQTVLTSTALVSVSENDVFDNDLSDSTLYGTADFLINPTSVLVDQDVKTTNQFTSLVVETDPSINPEASSSVVMSEILNSKPETTDLQTVEGKTMSTKATLSTQGQHSGLLSESTMVTSSQPEISSSVHGIYLPEISSNQSQSKDLIIIRSETVSFFTSDSAMINSDMPVFETGSALSSIDISATGTLDLNSLESTYILVIENSSESIMPSSMGTSDILTQENSSDSQVASHSSDILYPSDYSENLSPYSLESSDISTSESMQNPNTESVYESEYSTNLIPSISTEIYDSFSHSFQFQSSDSSLRDSLLFTNSFSDIVTSVISTLDYSGETIFSETPSLLITYSVSVETLPSSTLLYLEESSAVISASTTQTLPITGSSTMVNETLPVPERNKSGLTKGGKVALGICIPIILIAIIAVVVYFAYKRRYHAASWKLSDVVSYRPWSYTNATYYDDEVW